jgi:CBS domain-containing protein
MTEHRIRQLPVVDGSALLGIITDRDIALFSLIRPFSIPQSARKRSRPKSGRS